MPVIEGTTNLKTAVGEYDFAVDGGAVGTIVLRSGNSLGNNIPNGSVIISGYIEVDTVVTSGGAAPLCVNLNAAGDGVLLAATVVSGAPWSSTGANKAIIPVGSGANAVK